MPTPGRATPTLLAIPPALLAVVAFDATRLPAWVYRDQATLLFGVTGHGVLAALVYLSPALLLPIATAALQAIPAERWPWRASRHAALLAVNLLFCVASCAWILALDILPLLPAVVVAYAALAGVLTFAAGPLPPGRRANAILSRTIPAALGLAGAVVLALSARVFPGGYPALHSGLLGVALVLLAAGLAHLLAWPSMARARLAVAVGCSALLGVVVGWALLSGAAERIFRHYTFLGQAAVAAHPLGADPDPGGPVPGDDPDAAARFARHHNLPELPAALDLTRYNVLLITGDATGFLRTSLGDPRHDTTPRLRAWSAGRGLVFTRAYAPSTNTLQSNASLFTMTYPSAVALETYSRRWLGRVLDQNVTVAELFRDAGHDTFWVGFDHEGSLSRARGIRGLDQGFRVRTLINDAPADTDRQIADRAIATLETFRGRRFFGWIAFGSPHAEYVAHFPDRPAASPLDRYRQEVRFMDQQLGRVLDALRRIGLERQTIVIFTSDHGEELGEHGGKHHGSTLYEEVLRVPLVIAVPGLPGRTLTAPTSLLYLFPWLLSHGPAPMRAAVAARLTREIGPMLRDTKGAIVAELIGHDRMKSALIYPDRKLHYDFYSRLIQVYDVARDPLEQEERSHGDAGVARAAEARLAAYRRVRYRIRKAVVGR